MGDPAGPQSPTGKPTLQERLAKLAQQHTTTPEPDPAPQAEPPTEEESLAALAEGFPEADVATVPENG